MSGDLSTAQQLVTQADGLLTTASAVRGSATHLGELAARLGRMLDGPELTGGWQGPSADSARRLLERRSQGIGSVAAALEVAHQAMSRAGAAAAEAAARSAGVPHDVVAATAAPFIPRSPQQALTLGAEVALQGPALPMLLGLAGVGHLEVELRAAVLRAAGATATCAAALVCAADRCRAVQRAAAPVGPAGSRAEVVRRLGPDGASAWLATVPSVTAAPGEVARWWSAHSTAEQLRLCTGPSTAALVGALDAVPVSARDRANRAVLARRLAAWAAVRRDRGAGGRGESPDAARAGAAHLVDLRVLDELDRIRVDPATGRRVPVLLVGYEPDAWTARGRVALAFGSPDSATHVAYVVPGLGQHAGPGLPGVAEHAWQLYAATRRLAARPTVATVAWLGYDTPDVAEVAFVHRAQDGAARLAREVSGLRAARGEEQPHVSVVGHSYGSVVAGLAAVQAPGVLDDVAVVGSPGVGVDHADELPVPDGHVWVGAASADPVSHLSRFGEDPAASSFGGHRFPAETSPALPFTAQHSHYFDAGSQSLGSLARIVSGCATALPPVPGRTDHGYLGAGEDLLLPPALMALLHRVPEPTFDDPAAVRVTH